MLAALGYTTVAVVSAGATVVILALREQLHGWLKTLDQTDMHAAARYAVIALIVLPLLPDQAYGPYAAWNPRQLWMVVVLVTGLSFRSEEHTSELQSLMRNSYAVFCLKKKQEDN